MNRWCYCSKLLPGKSDQVRLHWKNKALQEKAHTQAEEESFWNHLKMTGFDSWLQSTSNGDYIIHCLEGNSFNQIFKGLREKIIDGNSIALKLQNFYFTVLGKDYSLPSTEPHIESLLDITLASPSKFIKRAFFYPLLPHEEEKHRHFNKQSMSEKKGRHEAMMRAFGISRLSTWLQTTSHGKYIIVYSERHVNTPLSSADRLKQGEGSFEWKEIASHLSSHTGLKIDELSPSVEWLTQS